MTRGVQQASSPGGIGVRLLEALTRTFFLRRHASRPRPDTVAVVVPLSRRSELRPSEEVSIRHLCHFLGGYDKYLVAPAGSDVRREGFGTIRFQVKFFGSPAAHNHLLFWPGFYEAFGNYEFILIYHLDSLVFSDELRRWCRAGWDYIGAPWVPCADTPWVQDAQVGNGGFTLKRVESALQVLYNRYHNRPVTYWADLLTRNARHTRPLFALLGLLQRAFPRWETVNLALSCWRRSQSPGTHGYNNDHFWASEAVRYLPTFKVASVEDGLRFAFEAAPRACFELNHRQLPFGCHAWEKFDREFWEPHLLPAISDTQRLAQVR
jgi:hypothetical protein